MRRNIRGNGTIVQLEKDKPTSKCRKWKLKVSLGKNPKAEPTINPQTGKPVYKYIQKCRNFEGTYTNAQKALRKFIEELEGGIRLDADKTGIVDYAREFARKRIESGSISEGTAKLDGGFIKLLERSMGNPVITDVDVQDIDNAILLLQREGGIGGRPISNAYIIRYRKWLSTLMNKAVVDKVAHTNPVPQSILPQNDTRERVPLTSAQALKAIELLTEPLNKFAVATFVAMFCAVRRGEACGLTWEDIDFESLTIHVKRNITSSKKIGNTKGKKSRTEPMNTWLAAILTKWQDVQRAASKEAGFTWSEKLFVVGEYGEVTNPQRVTEWWRMTAPYIVPEGTRFHDLRHTCLTLMAHGGADLPTLQGIAGHASATTTQTYIHANAESKRRAANGLEVMVFGKGRLEKGA